VSFVAEFNQLPFKALLAQARQGTVAAARQTLGRRRLALRDLPDLLSPGAGECLEEMCRLSHALTLQRFGKVLRLFAPLYLSNECVNNCRYCGFSRDNPILRVTLSVDEVKREGRQLIEQGFRNILLVAGEHPKFVSTSYLAECVAALHKFTPSVSLEVGTLRTEEYQPLVQAGADGLVVYQETYDRATYGRLHVSGPKRDFDWRLAAPERGYAAGFRRLGIGALLGLADWRTEAIALAAHADYLLRHCWKAALTLSIPRFRPCAGEFQPESPMSDRELVQLLCALRLVFPDVGLVLSTRESAPLRDGLMRLGITLLSAGSHTEPGGYTGAGREHLHRTERGHFVALDANGPGSGTGAARNATAQFEIADHRSAGEVAEQIRNLGYEPVWKDWDTALA
jgi:2-iminoacetate synthase